jgi:hypothetical protein
LVIALVITTDGFPLAYEVMDGNTSGRTTLRGFLDKIEKTYGKVGDGPWDSDRGDLAGDARSGTRDFYCIASNSGGTGPDTATIKESPFRSKTC